MEYIICAIVIVGVTVMLWYDEKYGIQDKKGGKK